jgi:hypothetical protein
MHGAALTQQIFMPPGEGRHPWLAGKQACRAQQPAHAAAAPLPAPAGCRALLELHSQTRANHHYQNLATYLGSWYKSVEWLGSLSVPLVLDSLTGLMDEVDAAGGVCAQQMG